jgi:hypothetical protein
VENADLLKPWQLAREKYKQQKRLVGDREKSTLARLKRFTATLKAAAGGSGASKGIPEGPTQVILVRGGKQTLRKMFALNDCL